MHDSNGCIFLVCFLVFGGTKSSCVLVLCGRSQHAVAAPPLVEAVEMQAT